MLNHGINTNKTATNFASVRTGTVGIPFFVGCWPVHLGKGYTGVPQIAYGFDGAKELGGYSDEWRTEDGDPKWTLCEAMYSQFKLFMAAPAIFHNIFNPEIHKKAVESSAKTVTDHIVSLSLDVIKDDSFIVIAGEDTLVEGTDYEACYTDSNLVIELLKDGKAYDAVSINVSYNEVDLSKITETDVSSAIESVEQCKARFGIVPDLLAAPGWSQNNVVASILAAKASSINGIFMAKAVVDLDTSESAANTWDKVAEYKNENGYISDEMIVCWPLKKVGDRIFNYSTLLCGRIASTDAENGNVPFESPSNKALPISGCVNKAGEEILLTVQQADAISYSAGVVTAINYDGWVVWGNYMGCHPSVNDVAKEFICTSRMQDFICNTFVKTYWSYLDKPLTRVLIDAIVNSFNSWLAGLTHEGKLYKGEIAYVEDNNPTANLIAGHFRLDASVASPVPAQRADLFVEFDVDALTEALNG